MGVKLNYLDKSGIVVEAGDAILALTEIRDEINEVVEGASGTNRENTQRIQTLGETKERMDKVDNGMPDICDELANLPIKYRELQPKKSWGRVYLSRADNVDNANAIIEAAVQALREFIDKEQAKPEDVRQELIDEAESAADNLQAIVDECTDLEFPSITG